MEIKKALTILGINGAPTLADLNYRYRKLAKGYVVYSVGTDREDNGAKENTHSSLGPDVIFRVAR